MSDWVESRYRVAGMDCASCAAKVEAAIMRLPTVIDVSVSVTAGTMTVRHELDPTLYTSIKTSLKSLGYSVANADAAKSSGAVETFPTWSRTPKGALTLICALALLVAYTVGYVYPPIERSAFLVAIAMGLLPVMRRAVADVLAGSLFTIETLMSVAAIGAFLIGAVEEAAVVVLLFLVGELLEGVASAKARSEIRSLANLTPKTAWIERNGDIEEISAEELTIGSIVRVRPGDRIPADGNIIEGLSAINEAPITGESLPVSKSAGDGVFAGSINGDRLLRVRVTSSAKDNTIARVVRLVEEAQEAKSATERIINRVARYYTPAVMLIALMIAVIPPLFDLGASDEWIYKGLAVLLIGCPCALVISTPAAISAALAAGARRGLLIKGGLVLEEIGRITTVVLDKTGTLTYGCPQVTAIVPRARSEKQILSIAAALEVGSSHPLAQAIIKRAREDGAPVPPASDLLVRVGVGIEGKLAAVPVAIIAAKVAQESLSLSSEDQDTIEELQAAGNTVSVVLAGGAIAGYIAMRDEPRPDAKSALEKLKSMGVNTVMLTGDHPRTASAMAQRLGVDVLSGLLPQDKQRIVMDMQGSGYRVVKVGDGINDAPALATANVGIAMGGGTDVALEAADSAILSNRMMDVVVMIALGRRTIVNIYQNITIALGLKAVFLITTVAGVTGLWPAILADTGATVLVTLNALRLLKYDHT